MGVKKISFWTVDSRDQEHVTRSRLLGHEKSQKKTTVSYCMIESVSIKLNFAVQQ